LIGEQLSIKINTPPLFHPQ